MRVLNFLILNIKRLRYEHLIKKYNSEKQNIIYVDISSLNYWWGIYGLARKTSWEDVDIYIKEKNKFKLIEYVCICTKPYLTSDLEDEDDIEFLEEINKFLEKNDIYYHYYYDDNRNSKGFYEVPFEAERNKKNIKPRSMELWHPGNGIDKSLLDESIKNFSNKFLNINPEKIEYKDFVSYDEALKEYILYEQEMQQCTGIVFSDEVVEKTAKEFKVSNEKALEMLNKSVKG